MDKINLGNCESSPVYIHHSRVTKDSRNSTLMALYLKTLKCNCKKYYTGAEDKLLRVSGITHSRTKRAHDMPLHFISYDVLFEYHSSVISGGNAQNSFVTSKNELNLVFRGNDASISRRIFQKGYEIFMHSLKYNVDEAWSCDLCHKELDTKQDKREVDFEAVEVHISDGIGMGTIQNTIKGFVSEDIFKEEKVENIVIKGIEAKERTFINQNKQRTILSKLSSSNMSSTDIREAIKLIEKQKTKSKNIIMIRNLLKRLQQSNIPDGYKLLIKELGKCSPIAILLPSHDSLDYKILSAFLESKHNIFKSFEVTKKVTNAFPLVVKMIQQILNHEKSEFLPADVSEISNLIMNLIKCIQRCCL